MLAQKPPEPLPALGDKLSARLLEVGERQRRLCATHPAQLDPCLTSEFDGIKYSIAYDAESKRVTYIETSDRRFRTPIDQKVGDEIPISEKDVLFLPGWIVFGPPTSGDWRPIIGGPDGVVNLKNGDVLKVWGKPNGSSGGLATIEGFAKGPQRPKRDN